MPSIAFLDRLLDKGRATRRIAAVAGPHGVHAVQYGSGREGVVLESGIRQTAPGTDVQALAEALADGIASLGSGSGAGRGRGGDRGGRSGGRVELALALSGFGTAHHILTLPPADEEILRPIVRRELLRYYPDLDDPVIGFVFGAEAESAPPPSVEILVGAVPRRVAVELSRALSARGIALHHLTVLPQVLQSLYDAFDGSDAPAVMVLVPEIGMLIGCFHRGSIRLFIEPPQDVHGRPVRDPASVAEQVERANLFLRQQFPTARVDRVLLASSAGELTGLRGALEDRLDSDVVRLAESPPGSLIALGAGLSSERHPRLELLPPEVRPRTAAERLTRRLALAAGVLVALAGMWWAGAGMAVSRAQAEQARSVEREVSTLLPEVSRTEQVLEARRAHQLRLVFLQETASTRAEVRRIMAGVASESRPSIQLNVLTVERSDRGWAVSLAGLAEAGSSAAAVRAIDALFRGIPQALPVLEAEFGGMESMPGGNDAPVAIGFDMSFIVLWQTDLAR